MHLLERLPQETDRSYALRTIKENIINLDLAPGSQISESEICTQMGLSRTPVREALLELSRVKIVKIVPQKKSTVALVDYALVEEARFMRNVLECAVVELDCELAAPEGLRRLEDNVKLQRFYLEDHNSQMLMELDDQFHAILFSIAQKTQVYEMTRNMLVHFDRVRRMALDSIKDIKIVEDHGQILEAIRDRDAERAKQLMQIHLSRYKYDAKEILKEYPEYFKK